MEPGDIVGDKAHSIRIEEIGGVEKRSTIREGLLHPPAIPVVKETVTGAPGQVSRQCGHKGPCRDSSQASVGYEYDETDIDVPKDSSFLAGHIANHLDTRYNTVAHLPADRQLLYIGL